MPAVEAHHLLNPIRGLALSPGSLVRCLGLKPDFTVLELGPGPGYFSPAVARALPKGKLVLVDVQQEMLDMARKRLEGKGIGNVEYRRGDAIALPAENESFDVVFLAAVLGEVPDRAACLREIHRVLRPGGLLSVTEYTLGDPHVVPFHELQSSVQAAGFQYCSRHGRLFHYTLGFRKLIGPAAA
jgi:ubiquinone/menaquinone biosynthesis C-methylase UbiE